MNLKRWAIVWCLMALSGVFGAGAVRAHGVVLEVMFAPDSGTLTVTAAFDTGEILDEAQVAVFAPSNLINPWLTGVTDSDGAFSFMPDFDDEGEWTIQVRKAGHGGQATQMIDAGMAPSTDETASNANDAPTTINTDAGRIVITGDAVFEVRGDVVITTTGTPSTQATPNPSITNDFSPAQIIIMSASVIWGAIGTALYFNGRSKPKIEGTDDAH